jgi:hypothetical protein
MPDGVVAARLLGTGGMSATAARDWKDIGKAAGGRRPVRMASR